jgi:hypothetical protein
MTPLVDVTTPSRLIQGNLHLITLLFHESCAVQTNSLILALLVQENLRERKCTIKFQHIGCASCRAL